MLNGSDVIVLADGVPALDVDATGLQLDLKQAIVNSG
jgi:hypothetical protein